MKKIIQLLIALLFPLLLSAQMNGVYTIGSLASDNFSTFNEAVDSLVALGVNGSVTINARAGIYNEKVSIPYINGVSAANTILFQSLLQDRTFVNLTDTPTAAENYIVQLDGANYISFNEITFIARDNTNLPLYSSVIKIENNAHHNRFINNNILNKEFPSSLISTPADFNRISVYSPASKDTHNVIADNVILGGVFGIYFTGSGLLPNQLERNNRIIGNELRGQTRASIYTSLQESIRISGNSITSLSTKLDYFGITSKQNFEQTYIGYNILAGSKSGVGINIDSTFATDSKRAMIENNFVQIGEDTNAAVCILIRNSHYVHIRSNNTNITTNSGFTPPAVPLAVDSFCKNITIINNNLINSAGGICIAIDIDTVSKIVDNMDYNNIWNDGGGLLATTVGPPINNLPAWRAATLMDSNSLSDDPIYFSPTDLHICQPLLDSAGLATDLATDIDFQIRNFTNPDIGADEIMVFDIDIGIIDANLDPIKSYSCNMDSIFVVIKNLGRDTITNYTVQWEVNGVLQTPVNVSGSLGPCENDTVILGPIALNYGLYDVDFWIELTGDPNPSNDTFRIRNGLVRKPLNGVYTVGGIAPDFMNFTTAKSYIEQFGICGPVVFNVRNGTYNEKVNINPINGSSVINTVTFQSENGDSTLVILTARPDSITGNYVLKLNGASHFIINEITIVNAIIPSPLPSDLGRVVVIDSISSNIKLLNNRIIGTKLATAPAIPEQWANIFSDTLQNDSVLISNNAIIDGAIGILFKGTDSLLSEKNIRITGNDIAGQVHAGIHLDFQENPIVNYNAIALFPQILSENGILLNTTFRGFTMTFNRIRIANMRYGIRINNSNIGFSVANSLLANNFVAVGIDSLNSNYGIWLDNSYDINVFNNNVNNISSDTNSSTFIEQSSKNISLLNNVLAATGGSRCIVLSSLSSIDTSDFNDLWNNFSGTTLVDFNVTPANDLATWRSSSGMDQNSTSANPLFNTPFGSDLHVCSDSLSNKGLPLAVITVDIDGEPRSPTTPDIGADEFDSVSAEIGINALTLCPLDTLILTVATPGMLYQWSSGQFTRSIRIISPTGLMGNIIDTISVIAYNACDTAWDTVLVTYSTGLPFTLGNDTSLCFDDSLTLTAISVSAITSYTWSTGSSASNILVKQPGGIYWVSITDGVCSNVDSTNITFIGPSVNLGNDTFLCSGATTILDAGAGYDYSWSTGDSSQTYTVTAIGTYSVTVSDSATGCSVSDNILITDCPLIGVPSAFSPNGDGQNDILYVKGAGLNSLNFLIFNRWGQRVFSTSDVAIGWNGTFKGKEQEMDVYVYYLQATLADGNQVEQRGKITLLR